MRSFILGNKEDITRDAFIWNTVGGMLNAGQSALLLVVISHFTSVDDSGVFALAFAIANLALALGKYGVRYFQASDIKEKYTYSQYLTARSITDFLMLALSAFYVIRGIMFLSYSTDKIIAIFLMCILKLNDSVEDVVHGRLQQKLRLDVAAKCMSIRYIGIIFIISVVVVVTRNMILSLAVGTIFSWIFYFYSYSVFSSLLGDGRREFPFEKDVWSLLKDCFPVALGAFLLMYIANAPKYAIDAHLNEEAQACFNYIFMPVYVVGLLSGFIFQPLITKMAEMIERGKRQAFLSLFLKLVGVIFAIGVAVMLGGYLLGIPVLSILYNIDLAPYKPSFMMLLLGGCLLAYGTFFSTCVTIYRKQNHLMVGYLIPAFVELLFADRIVVDYGVYGVAVLYTALMLLQALIFLGVLFFIHIHLGKVSPK